MVKIIATVGTSLLTNLRREIQNNKTSMQNDRSNEYGDIIAFLDDIKDKTFVCYKPLEDKIKKIKKTLVDFAKKSDYSCAEIKSLLSIQKEIKADLLIYLLASDSVSSALVAMIIKEVLENKLNSGSMINFNENLDVIEGLQVRDREKFCNDGMPNLVKRIYNIADDGYSSEVILNITAGYKGTIPFLTILGQVNHFPLYYIFEETDALIKIPQTPVDIDWEKIGKNADLLEKLEKEGTIEEKKMCQEDIKALKDIETLIERYEGMVCLNSLGIIFWHRYRSSYELFKLYKDEFERYIKLAEDEKNRIDKALLDLKKKYENNPGDSQLKHRLQGCSLPTGYDCFKCNEERVEIRMLWHAESRKGKYGESLTDFYIAIISAGSEVHNANDEYVKTFNDFAMKNRDLEMDKFHVIKIKK